MLRVGLRLTHVNFASLFFWLLSTLSDSLNDSLNPWFFCHFNDLFSLVQFQTDFEAGTSYSCALISCLLEDSGVFGGGRPLFRPFLFTLSRCRL